MRDILRITIGLTVSCLIAAFVMGSVFTVTYKAKKHNEHVNIQETMLGLLGYNKANPPPADLKLYGIYRYIIDDNGQKYMGYMVPVNKGNKTAYELLTVTLDGKFVDHKEVPISEETALERTDRDKALKDVLKSTTTFLYADKMLVAMLGDRRLAYLLPGEFPGFKTFVKVMLALNPNFEILGLEIMEEEEDPGLGGEIKQEYFKNQFKNKTYKKIKELDVTKEPLPDEYRRCLETKKWKERAITKEDIEKIRDKYQDHDIYALTGATISSRAVTSGVKNIIKKFVYRIRILDTVIKSQKIKASF